MSGKIPQSFIDDLMARIDLVEVVDAKVPLKRSGRNYVARCPFHQEKTPSFTVSREKQLYHCFGCGAGGTAISFLMEFDHLGFIEAVEELARSIGLVVPKSDNSPLSREKADEYGAILDLQARVAAFYTEQLSDREQGVEAVRYLKKRGIDGATAKYFMLGFAPPAWDALRPRFAGSTLDETGLLVHKDNGRSYDRFRNRIMFPIRDRRGRVVGFGGRVLDDSLPKYLNSPETKVFEKSKQVYGLYELLRNQGHPERILVVEGYMDVIALSQHRILNAVATLGTALSKNHLEALFRFTRELVFCFDGDEAGKKAAWRAVEIALPSLRDGRTLRIMLLSGGHDPDSLVREIGQGGFERMIAESSPLSDYFFEYLGAGRKTDEIEDRVNLVNQAKPLIARLPSGVFRDMMEVRLRELARLENVEFGNSENPVDRGRKGRSNATRQKSSPIRLAISMLMQNPPLSAKVDCADPRLVSSSRSGIKLLLQIVDIAKQHPHITPSGLLERFRATPEEASLRKLAESEIIIPDTGIEAEFVGAMSRVLEQENEKRIERLLEKADHTKLTILERDELRSLLPSWGGSRKK